MRALHTLGARIAEESAVGKARLDQTARELFLSRDPVEVRGMPQLGRLLLQRRDQMRMRMAQCGNGDTGPEIQVARRPFGRKVRTFAAVERDVRPVIVRQQRRITKRSPRIEKGETRLIPESSVRLRNLTHQYAACLTLVSSVLETLSGLPNAVDKG
jgi:hypothetical protein